MPDHRLVTVYGASMGATPTAIPVRLSRGEQADVVILARGALDLLVESGNVRRGSETDLVRSPIAMAVRAGAAVPNILTVDGLRQTLLAAKSIAYSDSASGVYVSTELFQLLGIEQVAAKARKIAGTPVGEIVARGEAEVGFQQLSELLPVNRGGRHPGRGAADHGLLCGRRGIVAKRRRGTWTHRLVAIPQGVAGDA